MNLPKANQSHAPEWAASWIHAYIRDVGKFQSRQVHLQDVAANKSYDLAMVSPNLNPLVDNFVGLFERSDSRNAKFMYISESVPSYLQRAWLEHELYCQDTNHHMSDHGCAQALISEMTYVSTKHLPEYRELRLKYFSEYLSYLELTNESKDKIFRTSLSLKLLKSLADQ
jgi:hypothetical protein